MSNGLCKACSLNDHQHHKLALGGICIGCVCGFRPVARRHEVLDRERRLDAEAEVERLKAELAREANAHAGTASSHARLKAELNAERERHHATASELNKAVAWLDRCAWARSVIDLDAGPLEVQLADALGRVERLTGELRTAREWLRRWSEGDLPPGYIHATEQVLKETKP